MSIETHCPHCWQPYELADSQQGKTVRCRACDKSFTVAKASASAKGRASETAEKPPLIIRETFNLLSLLLGVGAILFTLMMGAVLVTSTPPRPIPRGWIIVMVLGFAFGLLVGAVFIIAPIYDLRRKWHLAITDSELKYRRGDKLIRGRIPFSSIHSTKIDQYQERAKQIPIRVLFIYLLDEGIATVKWPPEWRPERNILFLPNSFGWSLGQIEELIDERLEGRRRRDMGLR